ncbi:hypothetical protein [Vibrio phage VP06]|nr:hypothetical protein [Vibrio phage VP06]
MSEQVEEKPRKRRQRKQILSVAQRRIQRTWKLDEDVKERFIEAVLKGMSEERACMLVKINKTHYFEKKKLVTEYLNTGIEPSGGNDPRSNIDEWAAFIEDVESAIAEHEMNLIDDALDIDSEAKNKNYWARNMTILERRNRPDWGRQESITHSIGHYDPDDRFL